MKLVHKRGVTYEKCHFNCRRQQTEPETLADILKDKYNIIEAEDGRSGLEVLEKRKDDIVLVILDIVMPGMDGFAFMEEARNEGIHPQYTNCRSNDRE